MSYPDALGNFLGSYWQVILWVVVAVLFTAFSRGLLNLFLGFRKSFREYFKFKSF